MAGWGYQAEPPQRYSGNFARYRAGGGLVRPQDDVCGFIAAQPANRGDMARFYAFALMLDQLAKEGLDGDLVELGVYKGSTATLIATIARRLGRTAFLLDTFEGFAPEDLQGIDLDKKMEFSDTSMEAVQRLVGADNTRFTRGIFRRPRPSCRRTEATVWCISIAICMRRSWRRLIISTRAWCQVGS